MEELLSPGTYKGREATTVWTAETCKKKRQEDFNNDGLSCPHCFQDTTTVK
jgi:hypothetical protein